MKTQIPFKLVAVALLLPVFVFANDITLKKTNKEKIITKSFNVNADATLKVDNSFGNINIITWNKNSIEFIISIKVSGNDNEKVQEKLDGIDVEFSSSSNMVSAITQIENNKKSWWNWGKKASLKMEINYVIKMPITNNVDLRNKFGTINLDQLKGDSKIRCDHGKIITKELLSNSNDIEFNHTRDNYFEYLNSANISATHSSLTINKVENLNLKTQHTKSTIETAEDVDFKSAHGTVKIENVNTVNGRAQHLSTRIGKLFKNASLDAQHGSIKIAHVGANAEDINIDAQFSGVTMGYDADYNFNFDLDLQFGSLRDNDELSITNQDKSMHNKKYKGYYGAKDSGNVIKIKSQHGSVNFSKQ